MKSMLFSFISSFILVFSAYGYDFDMEEHVKNFLSADNAIEISMDVVKDIKDNGCSGPALTSPYSKAFVVKKASFTALFVAPTGGYGGLQFCREL